MAISGGKPRRLPEPACAVQIDTTPHRSESPVNHGFQRFDPSFNRTAVTIHGKFSVKLVPHFTFDKMNRNAIYAALLLAILPTVAIANPYPSVPYAQYTGLLVENVLITVILGVKGFDPLRFFYSWGLVTTSTFMLLIGWIDAIKWLVPMSRTDDWWFIVLPLLIGEIAVVLIEALVLQRMTLLSFFRRKGVASLTLFQALRYSTIVNVMSFLAGS